jgi:RNA polymerase sigma-70 factor (ECF subfamily)
LIDEISSATIVGRSPEAARQLASRARRRVQGAPLGDPARQRAVLERFLAAMRTGDVEALIDVLDPDFVATGAGETHDTAIKNSRGALAARIALVDGCSGSSSRRAASSSACCASRSRAIASRVSR